MPDKTSSATEMSNAGSVGDERPGVVLEVQRAVVLVHGFVHAAAVIPLGILMWAVVGTSKVHVAALWVGVIVLAAVPHVLLAGFELYLSAQVGRRLARLVRLVVGVYASLALVVLVDMIVPIWQVRPAYAVWLSFLTFGSTLGNAPELAVGLQALLALSAVVLTCAVGRRTLIAAAPAWLGPWLLSHGIRAVVGAAYYLVYDLGAEPLWRRIQERPWCQRLFMTGGGPVRVIVGVFGGPALAGVGAVIGWKLILLGRWFIPPILHPLMYLVVVDLVLLPLLPVASAGVIWLYRRVAARSEAWVFVASPIFVALAIPAALVLCWLALHRGLVRTALGVGRWQIGPANAVVQGAVGAVWVHLATWIVVTAFNAQTGLMLIGQEVPGAALFKRHFRTPVLRLPPEMQRNREHVKPILLNLAVNQDNLRAFQDYTMLTGESPDAGQERFSLLSEWTQRQLTGLPWYYSPTEFEEDRVERCVVFWGCLLLAAMTLIRWPGLHAVLPHVVLRGGVCVLRIAAPTWLLAACLVGTSGRPDMIAMIAGLALVGLAVLAVAYWLGWVISRSVGATRHYAPFIATRLLQKRRIAFFAIGAVTLCVAMVLIVISVMGGFLDLVRDRSRGLLGDLIMENRSLRGFAGYQEFSDRIKRLRDENGQPIVVEATPVIYTYGVLRFPVSKVTNMVRVVGIRLDESVRVTRFGPSLNFEKYYPGTTTLGKQQQPYWGRDARGLPVLPPDLEAARVKGMATITDPAERALCEREAGQEYPGPPSPDGWASYYRSDVAEAYEELKTIAIELQLVSEDAAEGNWSATPDVELDPSADERVPPGPSGGPASRGTATASAPASQLSSTGVPGLADRQLKLAGRMEDLIDRLPDWAEIKAMAKTFDAVMARMMDAADLLEARDKKVCQVINGILTQLEGPIETLGRIHTRPGHTGSLLEGVILGRDLVARRQVSGRYERYYARGAIMTVAVLPLTPGGTFRRQEPSSLALRYVDDSRTGVYDIDSVCVYIDFDFLQRTMEMSPQRLTDGSGYTSPQASQVLIKLTEGQDILARRAQLMAEWEQFCLTWPHDRDWLPMRRVEIHTWEEQQAQFIAAVQKEKIMVVTLFAVVSAVAIFLVLCIFYMIVTEKTRDIGILKSVGASAGGVAGVFLAYGAAIGVVGASLGLWIGTVFVHNINSVQNWIARIHPGLRIWSPEVYTFDIIPDTVKFEDAAVIFVVAIVSSVLGATIPALRAGRIWPVEALRYE